MRGVLRKCTSCGSYTLSNDKCPYCGGKLVTPHPPRFSPDDRFLKYRYLMRKQAGLIPD